MNELQRSYQAERAKKKPLGVNIGTGNPEANKDKIAAKPRGTGKIKPTVGQVWSAYGIVYEIISIDKGWVTVADVEEQTTANFPLYVWHNAFKFVSKTIKETTDETNI